MAGLKPRFNREILHWLRRLPGDQRAQSDKKFDFYWGEMRYMDASLLRAQFEEIFIGRQYAFSAESREPVILDCGGNIGLSAIWFKLNYPHCQLTVYEADPDVADVLTANLKSAGFEDVAVKTEAVWIANGTVSFQKTGTDTGRIIALGPTSYPAIDFSESLPEYVDLLKLDIEGAEYEVINRLCETKAIQRVRRIICEFHVWRDRTGDLLTTLANLRQAGMQIAMKSEVVSWIGSTAEAAPFEVVQKRQVLMEVFAWR